MFDPAIQLLDQVSTVDIDRLLAERSFREFVPQAWPIISPYFPFEPSWMSDCICEHLEAVASRQIRNLLINIPLRHGKSTLVEVLFPAWRWTRHPEEAFLSACYSEDLALRDAIVTRELMRSDWYQQRWGERFTMLASLDTKQRYQNTAGGFRYAVGVMGAATGEGGDYLLVDDPHNIKQSESEALRREVLRWWDEVFGVRARNPLTVCRVVIMQRVHEDDLSGHLLARGGWHHLCLPAEYEPRVTVEAGFELVTPQPHDDCPVYSDPRTESGELLWPGRFTKQVLIEMKEDLQAFGVSAQLQQRPAARHGTIIDTATFLDVPAEFTREKAFVVQFWDTAFSDLASADFTAVVTLAIDEVRRLVLLGAEKFRLDQVHLPEIMAQVIARERPDLVGVEVSNFRRREIRQIIQLAYTYLGTRTDGGLYPVYPVPVTQDKITRARAIDAQARAGLLFVAPSKVRAKWWPPLAVELAKFPRGAHDDLVDALSGAIVLALTGRVRHAPRVGKVDRSAGRSRRARRRG